MGCSQSVGHSRKESSDEGGSSRIRFQISVRAPTPPPVTLTSLRTLALAVPLSEPLSSSLSVSGPGSGPAPGAGPGPDLHINPLLPYDPKAQAEPLPDLHLSNHLSNADDYLAPPQSRSASRSDSHHSHDHSGTARSNSSAYLSNSHCSHYSSIQTWRSSPSDPSAATVVSSGATHTTHTAHSKPYAGHGTFTQPRHMPLRMQSAPDLHVIVTTPAKACPKRNVSVTKSELDDSSLFCQPEG